MKEDSRRKQFLWVSLFSTPSPSASMAFHFIYIVFYLFLSVLLFFYSLSFASMIFFSIHIVISLFYFVLLLVPYQAQSRSITKTDSGLSLLEEEEVAVGKEEEAQQQPHMLKRFFHRRLLEYPCLAPDPALPFLYHPPLFNSSTLHGRDLADLLRCDRPAIWGQHRGRDHFLVLTRPAWDFSQHPDADPPLWGTSFLHLPGFLNAPESVEQARPGSLPALCGGGVRDDEGATRKGKRRCFSSFKRKAKQALLFSVKKFGKLCHRSSDDGKSRKKRTPVPPYDAVGRGCILCFNFPPIPPDSPVLLDARLLSRLCEVPP